MLTPVLVYSGGGVNPLYDNDFAVDNVQVVAGKNYSKGQVLGYTAGSGTNVPEVQTITMGGTVTGGTYSILYGAAGIIIGPLAYNASNANIQAAFDTALGGRLFTVGGGALPGTPVTLTAVNEAAFGPHAVMTPINNLTGTTPTITITRSTPGVPANGFYDTYPGVSNAKRIMRYDVSVNQFGNVTIGQTDMASFGGIANRAVPTYFKGYFRVSDLIGLDATALASLGKLTVGNLVTDAGAILCMTGA